MVYPCWREVAFGSDASSGQRVSNSVRWTRHVNNFSSQFPPKKPCLSVIFSEIFP